MFWALGFPAKRQYPVRVTCRNCPEDPWEDPLGAQGLRFFDPATIERKLPYKAIAESGHPDQGWGWDELALISESHGGATSAEIDALNLLAALVVHIDSAPRNQKLACPEDAIVDDGTGHGVCVRPVMYISDLGTTFGGSPENPDFPNVFHRRWATTPVWKDPRRCIAELDPEEKDGNHSLVNPRISESGRQFLANLLIQLSDRQIRDLFTAARFDRLPREGVITPVSEWVRTFKEKRDRIVNHRCP